MEQIQSKSVCGGAAIGVIRFFQQQQRKIEKKTVVDVEAELQRFETARRQALDALEQLYEKAVQEVGEDDAAVFEIHQMMLDDDDYLASIREGIVDRLQNAEFALSETREEFARMMAEMDNPYMQARAADVRDISDRVLDCLCGAGEYSLPGEESAILAAHDLTPSQTVQLDKNRILAFITAAGSANSHTAILARTMGIPAVIQAGEKINASLDGKYAAVDGSIGMVYIDPDSQTLSAMQGKIKQEEAQKAALERYRGQPNKTRDGREILVYANIGSIDELDAALHNDAGGIGLFRSEFLYLESADYPGEERQFAVYRTVAKTMGDKRAIIRTMDIGADKRIGYFDLPEEENPALGLRGVRLCLERPDAFKTQLRALYRASAFGRLAVMFPMIASLWEIREVKQILAEVKEELRREGHAFNEALEIGVMIETPAAALVSDELAAEVDFFSIGTNDLTQYTLTVDRQNDSVERFCDPYHKAVLLLISMVVRNAHKNGIWAGICGELAGDTSIADVLLSLGVDELSVSPPKILPLRKHISEISLDSK